MRPPHIKNKHRQRRYVVCESLSVLLAACAVSGCGDDRLGTYAVTGTVLVDKKPADGAMVIFCPVSGSDELMKQRPFGFAGPDGKFELTTFDKGDGLPAGQYKILIQWPAAVGGDQRDASGGRPMGPDRLRGRYMNLERTPFSATIESGSNELPPFELLSK